MPVPYFKAMSPLARGTAPRGLLQRLANRVDDLTRTIATLEAGWGLEMSADGLGRVKLDLAYAPNPGGGGGGMVELTGFTGKALPIMKTETGHTDEVDHFELRVMGGTVQGLFGTMELIETTYYAKSGTTRSDFEERWPDYIYGTDEKETATIGDREIFWLEYDPEAAEGQRWSLEHGDELPASVTQAPQDPSNDENTRYFAVIPLFRVEYLKNEANVNQWHAGSVVVPTATNVVEIQQPAAGEEEEEEEGV